MNKKILVGIIIFLVIIIFLKNNNENINTNDTETHEFENIEVIDNIIIENATIENFTGIIVMWSGNTLPDGWVLCDGLNGTPDLRNRFILSSDQSVNLPNRTIGNTGGAETHTLSIEEMPPHFHDIVMGCSGNNCNSVSGLRANLNNNYLNNYNILNNVDGNRNRQWPKVVINTDDARNRCSQTSNIINRSISEISTGFGILGGRNCSDANIYAKKFFTDTTGGDSAKFITNTRRDFSNLNWSSSNPNTWKAKPHNNMPPFYVLAYIMKL